MVALGERASPTGQELLAEFIQYGHQRPFEEIVRRYAGMVFNVCFRVTKDKHEAEDAVQAVFLTLALQAKRGTEIKALGPWLQQVAKRLSLDMRRSKKRRKTREERHHVETTVRREQILGDALPSADMDELKTILHEELQKLPAKYRLPLILHYFGGMNRDEMAAELNCKASTLGVRIFRGREMLAGRLSGRGINISSAALAMLMGYSIKRVVSDSLIASTSHAATAMLAGYDGSGMASANVIGLTRRASNAMVIGKVKMAAMSLLIAGTSLGAGAKALQILPTGTLQRMISNQILKLVQPILRPLTRPMLSQAPAAPTTTAQVPTDSGPVYIYSSSSPTATPAQPVLTLATPTVLQPTATPIATSTTISTPQTAPTWASSFVVSTPAAPASSNSTASTSATTLVEQASSGSSGGGGSTGAGSGASVGVAALAPTSSRSFTNTAAAQFADVVIGTHSLTIASAQHAATAADGTAKSTGSGLTQSSLTQSPTATILIPSVSGTITETNTGMLRGWGTPTETGTLVMSGVAVADGDGIDRTLNLTHFSTLATSTSATTAQSSGLQTSATQIASAANLQAPSPANSISSTISSASTGNATDKTALPSISTAVSVSTSPLSSSSLSSAPNSALTTSASTAASTSHASTSHVSTAVGSAGFDSVSAVSSSVAATSSTSDIGSNTASNASTPPPGTIAPPLNGWYAVDHGRLCMSLQPSAASPSVVTWGESADGSLSLINSVRLSVTGNSTLPSQLSLLSPDRDDVVNLNQITGATIGLWTIDSGTVDPVTGSIADANLEVHYDSLLANALGANSSSIELWALNADTDQWSQVASDSLVVDTADDLVFGQAEDFSAFAVSALPAPGANLAFIRAHQLATINDDPMAAHHDDVIAGGIAGLPANTPSSSGVSSIPEPVGLPLLAVGLGLLGRRRRR